jgi:microcystin-dependent protein
MACQDCFNNCPDIVSDQCILYTGPSVELLGVCQGDPLSTFEAKLIAALLTALDGTGINPKDVTLANCSWLKDQLSNATPGLNQLLQLLIDNECSLHDAVVDIQTQLSSASSGVVFNTSCLTGLPDNPTSDDILQATVSLLCSISATVTTFSSTYVRITDLSSLVTPIVNSIISASNSSGDVPQQYTKMVPYVAYEYYGPLSNFDAGGIGVTSLGFTKVYLCNGSNGTPDKRGRVTVGAIVGVPGGSLDSAVNPSNPLNPNWALKDKNGENTHLLTIPEIPSHTHGVTDPGHKHNYGGVGPDGRGADNAKTATPKTSQTSSAFTGISINATGGSQPHNNIQPSIAAYSIMYIP